MWETFENIQNIRVFQGKYTKKNQFPGKTFWKIPFFMGNFFKVCFILTENSQYIMETLLYIIIFLVKIEKNLENIRVFHGNYTKIALFFRENFLENTVFIENLLCSIEILLISHMKIKEKIFRILEFFIENISNNTIFPGKLFKTPFFHGKLLYIILVIDTDFPCSTENIFQNILQFFIGKPWKSW